MYSGVIYIKAGNREQTEVDHFKYIGSVLTRNVYCTRKIKMRISMDKQKNIILGKQAKHWIQKGIG